MGCHSLLQGIFLTQGLNPGLLHCRRFLFFFFFFLFSGKGDGGAALQRPGLTSVPRLSPRPPSSPRGSGGGRSTPRPGGAVRGAPRLLPLSSTRTPPPPRSVEDGGPSTARGEAEPAEGKQRGWHGPPQRPGRQPERQTLVSRADFQ